MQHVMACHGTQSMQKTCDAKHGRHPKKKAWRKCKSMEGMQKHAPERAKTYRTKSSMQNVQTHADHARHANHARHAKAC